ncbi:MAG TPA: D-amino acid aminotransferase [Casimicrobiaceae bacterium]|jgi:D-alanine transaminase
MTVYLNGEFLPIEQAKVSVLDRGFIYGDGVYELVPVYRRQPYRMREHLARLNRSCAGIGLANPHDAAAWESIIRDLIARMPFDDQAVYFQVTRGVARRDHAFPAGVAPTVFMMSNPLALPSAEQVERGVAVITGPDERWLHCDLKTTSLLGNVLARQAAVDAGAVESVLFRDGYLTEASASNVLIVKGGLIVAPPKDNLILPGITYDATFDLARKGGLEVAIRPVSREEALGADEMWLSSSSKEVLAVTKVDGRPFAGGMPGPVFRRVYALFQASKPKRS